MLDVGIEIITASWLVLAQMSHYLIFGFLMAGLLSLLVSPRWLERHLGGNGFGPIWKASLFGVPLPLCSCGVIPVAASLRQHGASRGATAAFLLSTPQTGVDSILVTYSMLGPLFAIYRPVAALFSGLLGGLLVRAFGAGDEPEGEQPAANRAQTADPLPLTIRLRKALVYGFVQLPRDIGLPLLAGTLIAGAMSALMPPQYLAGAIGGGLVSILLLMAAGVPVYVCATASVPIAAGFLHLGASPGAALAFLVAGPATNAAAITTIWKIMGKRTALLYLGTVALSAVISGLVLDWIVALIPAALPQWIEHDTHHHQPGWWLHVMAVILLGIIVAARWIRFPNPVPGKVPMSPSTDNEKLELAVAGMNCGHCQNSVQRAIEEMEGVESVEVDLQHGRATVIGRDLNPEPLVAKVAGLGYRAEVIEG